MTSLAKVPCTIVTGFLGAGKTTLVRHVLENANGRRLAVIVNEFGDVGIDGEILKSCGIESCPEDAIIELANGCICCTVADDFVPALKGLLDRPSPPEHIVIETSGLALPKPLDQAKTSTPGEAAGLSWVQFVPSQDQVSPGVYPVPRKPPYRMTFLVAGS